MPGSFNYYGASLDGRHYLPLGDRLVFASRLQLGNIKPIGDAPENVPFSKKYFLGGATTIRGWGRYEVSPVTPDGVPIGGNSLLAVSGELRAARRQAGRRLLLDSGNVWARSGRSRRATCATRWAPAALPDAGRSDPLRFRLSAESHPRPAGERQPAEASLPLSLQHRPGVLTTDQGRGTTHGQGLTHAIVRRLTHVLVIVITLVIGAAAARPSSRRPRGSRTGCAATSWRRPIAT